MHALMRNWEIFLVGLVATKIDDMFVISDYGKFSSFIIFKTVSNETVDNP